MNNSSQPHTILETHILLENSFYQFCGLFRIKEVAGSVDGLAAKGPSVHRIFRSHFETRF